MYHTDTLQVLSLVFLSNSVESILYVFCLVLVLVNIKCMLISVLLPGKSPEDCGSGGECGLPSPGAAFKEVWQVKVWPKGLGQARNLIGIHRLCLTDKTVNFVKLNSDVAAVVLQLMNVRRCGHSEIGRASCRERV